MRGIAHAMRKPLARTAEDLRVAQGLSHDPALVDQVARSVTQVEHLQRLVDDLIDLGRSHGKLEIRSLPVARVLAHAVEQVRRRFPAATIELAPCEGTLFADEVALRCALVNLLENALEIPGAPPWAALRATHTGELLTLHVEDRGGGLPAGVAVFEPFVTTKEHGTGLGLATVREVCRAHGGRVRTHATAAGTRFELELPTRTS